MSKLNKFFLWNLTILSIVFWQNTQAMDSCFANFLLEIFSSINIDDYNGDDESLDFPQVVLENETIENIKWTPDFPVSCPICIKLINFANLNKHYQCIPCGHFFHKKCLDPWLAIKHNDCPLCRDKIYKLNSSNPI